MENEQGWTPPSDAELVESSKEWTPPSDAIEVSDEPLKKKHLRKLQVGNI